MNKILYAYVYYLVYGWELRCITESGRTRLMAYENPLTERNSHGMYLTKLSDKYDR